MKYVLGIETSCDETAAAVAAGPVTIASSIVNSQAAAHAPYGGVVPEIAARRHVAALPQVIEQAVQTAGIHWPDISAVAVTHGPGLATSLLTGIAAAKGLALRLRVPLIAINHLEAHLYSVFLAPDAPAWSDCMPMTALIVSGGHTCLVHVTAPGAYKRIGNTLDDAAGEAFDKGAKLLGLGYPGGPAIERTAREGRSDAMRFPRGRTRNRARPDFSFSGLKTALRYHLEKQTAPLAPQATADIAAAYQAAIVDVLVERTLQAAMHHDTPVIGVGGGVSLNRSLREKLQAAAQQHGRRLLLAPPALCGDNAAMVAALAGAGRGQTVLPVWELDACPGLGIG